MNARQWLADTPSLEDTLALKQHIWNERPEYPFTEAQWDAWVVDCRRVEAMLWFVELLASASAQVFSITPPDPLQQVKDALVAAKTRLEAAPEGDDQRVPFFEGDILTCPYCKSAVWAEDEWCEDCGAVYDLVDGWSKPAIDPDDDEICEHCQLEAANCICDNIFD